MANSSRKFKHYASVLCSPEIKAKLIKYDDVSELMHMKIGQLESECRMISMADDMHKEFKNQSTNIVKSY